MLLYNAEVPSKSPFLISRYFIDTSTNNLHENMEGSLPLSIMLMPRYHFLVMMSFPGHIGSGFPHKKKKNNFIVTCINITILQTWNKHPKCQIQNPGKERYIMLTIPKFFLGGGGETSMAGKE